MENLESIKPTAIVIGLGISGLSVSRDLLDKGFKVIALEASNRIGGRIYTVKNNLTDLPPLEAGANWIHGKHNNPMIDLAKKFKVSHVAQKDLLTQFIGEQTDKFGFFKRVGIGVQLYRSGVDDFEDSIKKAASKHSSSAVNLQDVSDEALNSTVLFESGQQKITTKDFAEKVASCLSGGVPLKDTSAHHGVKQFTGSDRIVTGGYQVIATHLMLELEKHPDFEYHLNCPVTAIKDYLEGPVKVTANKKTYTSNVVIPTFCISQWKKIISDDKPPITFSPALEPGFCQLIDKKIHAGHMQKMFFSFERCFWRSKTETPHFIFLLKNLLEFQENNGNWFSIVDYSTLHPKHTPTLLISVYGKDSDIDLEKLKSIMLGYLKQSYKDYQEPIHFFVHQWQNQPYFGNAWPTLDASITPQEIKQLQQPLGLLYKLGDITGADTVSENFDMGKQVAEQIENDLSSMSKIIPRK